MASPKGCPTHRGCAGNYGPLQIKHTQTVEACLRPWLDSYKGENKQQKQFSTWFALIPSDERNTDMVCPPQLVCSYTMGEASLSPVCVVQVCALVRCLWACR